MIIDLGEIEGSSKQFASSIGADQLDLDNPILRIVGEVKVAGEVVKHAAQIDLKGLIEAPVEIECTRCLEPVSQELKIDFAVNFVRPEDFASDKEREVSAADLDTDVLETDRVDITEIVREQILLNLPEQLFCKPDCKGLCTKCGANLNLIDCDCDLNEIDPRWAALKDFRS